jgi:hypothetical protein
VRLRSYGALLFLDLVSIAVGFLIANFLRF